LCRKVREIGLVVLVSYVKIAPVYDLYLLKMDEGNSLSVYHRQGIDGVAFLEVLHSFCRGIAKIFCYDQEIKIRSVQDLFP
jgi:hypothetical protein